MACYHPLKGFDLGFKPNGKRNLKIRSYDVECLLIRRNGYIDDFYTVPNMSSSLYDGCRLVTDFIPIPCGQCIGCRLEYSRQWAVRCMLESESHENNYFITLTYNDEHLPCSPYVDSLGNETVSHPLVKEDLTNFIKRLRSRLDYDGKRSFRYFACGEYGSVSARPHYHMIAFGLDIEKSELKYYKTLPNGFTIYTHPLLDEVWHNKGYVIVGSCTFESCAYVARYITKKHKGATASFYDDYNLVPEYTVMSRRPGIAREYFENHLDEIFYYDGVVVPGGEFTRPPRYFDSYMNELDEELMCVVKDLRCEIAKDLQALKDEQTDCSYLMQLAHAEANKLGQIKKLDRSSV